MTRKVEDTDSVKHEAAGRPTGTGSRQQTVPEQGVQSGSRSLDQRSTGDGPRQEAARRYQDRPADEGKHGDAADEPNPGPVAKPIEPRTAVGEADTAFNPTRPVKLPDPPDDGRGNVQSEVPKVGSRDSPGG